MEARDSAQPPTTENCGPRGPGVPLLGAEVRFDWVRVLRAPGVSSPTSGDPAGRRCPQSAVHGGRPVAMTTRYTGLVVAAGQQRRNGRRGGPVESGLWAQLWHRDAETQAQTAPPLPSPPSPGLCLHQQSEQVSRLLGLQRKQLRSTQHRAWSRVASSRVSARSTSRLQGGLLGEDSS